MAKDNNDNVMGMLAHLLGIFTWFIGPLVLYIILKDQKGKPFENAKHSLNFQISLTIYYLVATILIFGLFGILYALLGLFALIFMIIATVKAYQGQVYKYPLEIQFLK